MNGQESVERKKAQVQPTFHNERGQAEPEGALPKQHAPPPSTANRELETSNKATPRTQTRFSEQAALVPNESCAGTSGMPRECALFVVAPSPRVPEWL